MAPYRRAAISGRGSPRYQARFGHSTLVSWQLIVENEPTGRFVSHPRDRVTLINPQRDADARGQPQSLDGQRVGYCPQANACAAGDAGSMAKAFSGRDTSTLRSEKHRLGVSIHSRRPGPAGSSKRLPRPGRRDVGPSRSGLRGTFNKTHRFYQGPHSSAARSPNFSVILRRHCGEASERAVRRNAPCSRGQTVQDGQTQARLRRRRPTAHPVPHGLAQSVPTPGERLADIPLALCSGNVGNRFVRLARSIGCMRANCCALRPGSA